MALQLADDLVVRGNITALGNVSGGGGIFNPAPTYAVVNGNASTANYTMVAANLTGAQSFVTIAQTGNASGNLTATLANATSTFSGATNPVVGASWTLRLINESASAGNWTVANATGWSLFGTMSVNQNTWRDFVLTLTSATTANLQSVGTGTYS